jgi:hypothetical protein
MNKRKLYDITIEKKKGKSMDIVILEDGVSLLNSKLIKEAKEKLNEIF